MLEQAGVEVTVLEAADRVGGRLRTDTVDGFVLDRGFQVLNPAYPAVRTVADQDSLGLQPFGAGIGVRRDDDGGPPAVLADPRREPGRLPAVLTSGMLHPGELLPLARWALPAVGLVHRLSGAPGHRLAAGADRSRGATAAAAGVHGELGRVVEMFLRGVLLEADGSASTAFTRLLIRSFLLGTPGLPRAGMQAFPEQLAARLRRPVVLGTPVEQVGPRLVRTAAGELRPDLVVLATGPTAAHDLLDRPPPRVKGCLTHWWAAETAPGDLDLLVVDGRPGRRGPVVNAAVVTNAAPSYAPAGRHLVQTTCLRDRTQPTDDEVRRHAGEVLGADTSGWQLVRRDEVAEALPAQPPPLVTRSPMEVAPGLVVAGDHVDTASIQGALVSGRRAAEGWLRRRGQRARASS